QPIPHGRPYRCHLNGPIHMMTARKRLGPEARVKRVMHPAMPEDIPEPAQEGVPEGTYETLGDLVQ
nr:hypothetical protein [Tanacetum cinerariifolium]